MSDVLVFDVNETLLDLAALDASFDELFGDRSVRHEWFMQVLQSAMVSIATGVHRDFATVGHGALSMVAARRGIEVGEDEAAMVLEGMRRLPPHPDVVDALLRLREAGVRLATLTNSPPETADAQLQYAGLAEFFEARLTVEGVGRLKPAPEPYHYAAANLGVQGAGMRLVAAHAWDVTGAIRAGFAAAFVARPGKVLDPTGETPDIIVSDLGELADRVLDGSGGY